LSGTLCGAERWGLWEVDRKHFESFEKWRCSRMKIRRTDHVNNEEILNEGEEYTACKE